MLGDMRTIRNISVLACLVVASFSCFGAICITYVSKEQAANEFDATLRTVLVTTNARSFRLEFAPQGRLQTFLSVHLETTARDGTLISKRLAAVNRTVERVVRNSAFTTDTQGNLSPMKEKTATVVVDFSVAAADLGPSRLTFYYETGSGFPHCAGIEFRIADFIKPEPIAVEPTRAPAGARRSL